MADIPIIGTPDPLLSGLTVPIMKDICPDCWGWGHIPGCKCTSSVDFVMGCCKICVGEGYITRKPQPPKELWIPS